MPTSKKRRKAQTKGRPAKKQELEGPEQEIEEATSGWLPVILASPALRERKTFPFLAPGECHAISGIVGSHIIDIEEKGTRNLAVMLDTRDGSKFIDND
ncbi:hypothetical protein F503_03094 [Ophiostoma piceae UAMH 11346]|uniref:Uncharacterized protein n=1 Tax=Ophiostoma piceae (strain UAMH 11346) TaxID=1262450 RepID=S3C1R1_OPHP1|nr:hypothetical protein F503_03094 [Ophiostoma piceae UAMH 11346]